MRSVLTVCLLALLLSACGSSTSQDSAEEFSGEERVVAATVENIEDAARENEPDTFCEMLLSDELLAALKKQGTNCTTAARQAFKDASSKDLTVGDVSIDGDKATVKVVSGSGSNEKSDTLELRREGTSWKVSAQLAS